MDLFLIGDEFVDGLLNPTCYEDLLSVRQSSFDILYVLLFNKITK